jgi:hypothetical protein
MRCLQKQNKVHGPVPPGRNIKNTLNPKKNNYSLPDRGYLFFLDS